MRESYEGTPWQGYDEYQQRSAELDRRNMDGLPGGKRGNRCQLRGRGDTGPATIQTIRRTL
jgi:hypothetical protein